MFCTVLRVERTAAAHASIADCAKALPGLLESMSSIILLCLAKRSIMRIPAISGGKDGKTTSLYWINIIGLMTAVAKCDPVDFRTAVARPARAIIDSTCDSTPAKNNRTRQVMWLCRLPARLSHRGRESAGGGSINGGGFVNCALPVTASTDIVWSVLGILRKLRSSVVLILMPTR